MTTCDKCCKYFEYEYLLIRHNNNKKDCKTIKNINKNCENRINKIDSKIKYLTNKSLEKIYCLFCEKSFSTKGNLSNHIRDTCSVKKSMEKDKNLILEIQNNRLNELNKKEEESDDDIDENIDDNIDDNIDEDSDDNNLD